MIKRARNMRLVLSPIVACVAAVAMVAACGSNSGSADASQKSSAIVNTGNNETTNSPTDKQTEPPVASAESTTSESGLGPLKCSLQMTIDDVLGYKASKAKSNYKIAYVPISAAGSYFFQAMTYGVQRAADDAGVTLSVASGGGFNGPSEQLTAAENAITGGAEAILLAPADYKASKAVVDLANEKGIPVIALSSDVDSDVAYKVQQDSYLQGKAAADWLAAKLPGGVGTGIVMGGPQNQTYAENRVQGFADQVSAKYPGITIADTPRTNDDPAEGQTALLNALTAHPDVNWIYAVADALVTPNAIPDNLQGKVIFIDSGWQPTTIDGLSSGIVDVTADAAQVALGYIALGTAVEVLDGGSPAKSTCLENAFLTSADVDSAYGKYELYPEGYKPGN